MTTRAFTLIEVLISITLGLAIVYVAFAGFRTASQCVTIVNRMSVENALLRGAYHVAHEELDFWRTYDDPDNAGMQPLRGLQMPFCPFPTAWPRVVSPGDLEAERGWNGTDRDFAPHDPRTWCRINMAEKVNSDLRFGQYGIYSNRYRSPSLRNFWGSSGYGGYAPHNWYANQLTSLYDLLGTYGFCDYMPANAIYACYSNFSDVNPRTNESSIPQIWINPAEMFSSTDGGQISARGKYRQTFRTSFMLPNPRYATGDLVADGRNEWEVSYGATAASVADFDTRTSVAIGLMDGPDAGYANDPAEKPELWPDTSVSVARFTKNVRNVNLCRIRWTSPLTGAIQEISFTGFGTSLRGARQQRKPGTGWTTWHGAGNPANDKSLDDY